MWQSLKQRVREFPLRHPYLTSLAVSAAATLAANVVAHQINRQIDTRLAPSEVRRLRSVRS